MMSNIQYLSQEKISELNRELEELKTKKRKEIIESLEFAKSLGDLSENTEYQSAREMQADVEQRIAELEDILKDAIIVHGNGKDVVTMGSVVLVKTDKETKQFQIVGSEEAKISAGKISDISPFGKSLIGKKVGDTGIVSTPKGQIKYKIVEIK